MKYFNMIFLYGARILSTLFGQKMLVKRRHQPSNIKFTMILIYFLLKNIAQVGFFFYSRDKMKDGGTVKYLDICVACILQPSSLYSTGLLTLLWREEIGCSIYCLIMCFICFSALLLQYGYS